MARRDLEQEGVVSGVVGSKGGRSLVQRMLENARDISSAKGTPWERF